MPTITRPPLRLSSNASCSATRTGWYSAISSTAKPSFTRRVCIATAVANTIGSAYTVSPVKWCSENHTAS